MKSSTATLRGAALAGAMALGFLMSGSTAMAAARECADELGAVSDAINDADFLGKKANADRSNLVAKLAAAEGKVELYKFSDAIDKLLDISDTATALADAPKPKLEDATGINNAVTAAIACVGGLGQ